MSREKFNYTKYTRYTSKIKWLSKVMNKGWARENWENANKKKGIMISISEKRWDSSQEHEMRQRKILYNDK